MKNRIADSGVSETGAFEAQGMKVVEQGKGEKEKEKEKEKRRDGSS
jgi:hypothetical protein